VDVITIELVEANETPAVVIIRWPGQAEHRAPAAVPIDHAESVARSFLLAPLFGWRRFAAIGGYEPLQLAYQDRRDRRDKPVRANIRRTSFGHAPPPAVGQPIVGERRCGHRVVEPSDAGPVRPTGVPLVH
jgi:hypothetical protein